MIAQRITYNIIFNGVAKVLSIALALFAIGMLARYLGTDGFGKYSTMLAFFGFFAAIGDFGLYAIATREISRENADESWILSRVFTLRMLISLVISLCTIIFVWFLPYEKDVQISILIASMAFIFSSGYGLINGLFQKHIAMDKVAIAELSGKLLQVATIIYVVKAQLSFFYVALGLLLTMLWSFIVLLFWSRKYARISFQIDWAYGKKFLRESAPMGISAIVTFLYFKCDTILLSFIQSQHDVGIYGAAYKIIETLIFFPAMVVGLVYPLFSRYIISDTTLFNKITNIIIKIFTIILIPLIITTYFLSSEIMRVVGGESFVEAAPALRILIFALGFIFFGQLFTNILIAGSQQKKLMIISVIAALVNIGANVILIQKFSYMGAAYVSVLTESFVAIAAIILTIRKTAFTLVPMRLSYAFAAGCVMLAISIFAPVPHPYGTSLGLLMYITLLFSFRVITWNDIMQLLSK